MCNKYNGWADHATWCLSMMTDGNYGEGDYHYWQSTVAELAQDAEDKDEHARLVSDALSDWYDSALDELGVSGFFRDMMAQPEFWEVAESLVSGWIEEGNKYSSEEDEEEEQDEQDEQEDDDGPEYDGIIPPADDPGR